MPEYGVVTLKEREKKSDDTIRNFADQLSYLMPYTVEVIDRSLRELISEGVLTLDNDRLYQKRMVKDGEISIKRSDAGKRGADSTNSRFAAANPSANDAANGSAKGSANTPANSEYENEYEIEDAVHNTHEHIQGAGNFHVAGTLHHSCGKVIEGENR